MSVAQAARHNGKADAAAEFDAIVIGAGIAGLTAAATLRKVGFAADIYEQAQAFAARDGGRAEHRRGGLERVRRPPERVGVLLADLDPAHFMAGSLEQRHECAADLAVGAEEGDLHAAARGTSAPRR